MRITRFSIPVIIALQGSIEHSRPTKHIIMDRPPIMQMAQQPGFVCYMICRLQLRISPYIRPLINL